MRRLSLIALLLLQACKYGNCCHRPILPSSEWTASPVVQEKPVPDRWWEVFDDPCLTSLIEAAYRDNYSLKSSFEKVVQAFYYRKQISSRYYPQLDGAFDYTKSMSQIAFGSAFFGGDLPSGTPSNVINFANGVIQEVLIGGFDASWEIDLFRHTYYEVKAACAQQGSRLEALYSMMVSLSSEVARNYLYLRWQQMQEKLYEAKIEILEGKLALNALLRERGIESDFPLLDTVDQVERLRESLFHAIAERQTAIYKIIALIGKLPPTCIDELQRPPQDYLVVPADVAVGVPSELLRRRPDIREAERNIQQAAAEVKVAIADFFPRLSLTGSYKGERTTFDQLVAAGPAWAYGLHLVTPIFHGGKLRAALQESRSAWRQNVFDYYETVVNSIAEAEGSIASFTQGQSREEAAHLAFEARKSSYTKTKELRGAGIVDEIQLLDAKNSEIDSRLAWIESRYNQAINLVAVYKALGGGWEVSNCR